MKKILFIINAFALLSFSNKMFGAEAKESSEKGIVTIRTQAGDLINEIQTILFDDKGKIEQKRAQIAPTNSISIKLLPQAQYLNFRFKKATDDWNGFILTVDPNHSYDVILSNSCPKGYTLTLNKKFCYKEIS